MNFMSRVFSALGGAFEAGNPQMSRTDAFERRRADIIKWRTYYNGSDPATVF